MGGVSGRPWDLRAKNEVLLEPKGQTVFCFVFTRRLVGFPMKILQKYSQTSSGGQKMEVGNPFETSGDHTIIINFPRVYQLQFTDEAPLFLVSSERSKLALRRPFFIVNI